MHPRSHQLTVGYLKCLIRATNQIEVMDRVNRRSLKIVSPVLDPMLGAELCWPTAKIDHVYHLMTHGFSQFNR